MVGSFLLDPFQIGGHKGGMGERCDSGADNEHDLISILWNLIELENLVKDFRRIIFF